MTTTTANPATTAQIKYIDSLAAELIERGTGLRAEAASELGEWIDEAHTDRKKASLWIDAAKTILNHWREFDRYNEPKIDVPEGMHRTRDDIIYKVQRAVHGSGNLYAKALVQTGTESWSFEYAPGAIRHLSAATAMTLEEAKEWGALYGTCCVCAKVLTNEESIAEGIGPVCKSKM